MSEINNPELENLSVSYGRGQLDVKERISQSKRVSFTSLSRDGKQVIYTLDNLILDDESLLLESDNNSTGQIFNDLEFSAL